jgi:hypothetical protein
MQAFNALSSEDRWRVRRAVFRGEAPRDPRMAAAAVELAQSYQQHGRRERWLYWTFVTGGIGSIVALILSTAAADLLHAVIFASLTLMSIVHLALNPAIRPKSVARSLEASRQVVVQGG